MYNPPAFKEDDRDQIARMIEEVNVGELITYTGDSLIASVLPFLYEPTFGEFGRLRGHLAKANPHWRSIDAATESLVLFRGVNTYISPAWYPSKEVDGKVVPTWNYIAVEARGHLEVHEETEWKLQMVSDLTARHESGRVTPWSVDQAPEAFLDSQLKAIVGVELVLSSIIGKRKLSQNRSFPDFQGAILGLEKDGETAISSKMRALDRTS